MQSLVTLPARALTVLAALAALAGAVPAAAVELQHETRVLAGFHRLSIDGQVNVTLVQGTTEEVTLEAVAGALARIHTDVHGGTLSIDVEAPHSMWQWFSGRGAGPTPRVTIHFRDLDRIEAAGAVTFDAESLHSSDLRIDFAGACTLKVRDLQATSLRLDGSGATKVEIAGKVGRQRIDLSGAGSYQAERLASAEAMVSVSGAGKAVVSASNTLAVDISGAGKVEYLGDPKLKQSISGIGRITRRDPD
jgi:Putative auto-transporter adhesin, head GIN domain